MGPPPRGPQPAAELSPGLDHWLLCRLRSCGQGCSTCWEREGPSVPTHSGHHLWLCVWSSCPAARTDLGTARQAHLRFPGHSILHPHRLLIGALRAPVPPALALWVSRMPRPGQNQTLPARGGSPRLQPPAQVPPVRDPVPQVGGQGTAGVWCPAEGPCPAPSIPPSFRRSLLWLLPPHLCSLCVGSWRFRDVRGCPQLVGPSPRREPSPRLWFRDSAQAPARGPGLPGFAF